MLPVNMLSLRLAISLIATTFLVSCESETHRDQTLQLMMEQNKKLSESITTMELAVTRAGDIDPTLEAQIQTVEHALTQKIRELTALQTKNNQDKIRLMELEQRMGIFEAEFRGIQQEAVDQANTR